MSDLRDWCGDYVDTLPPAIRPKMDDARFVTAARRARDNAWTANQAGRVVAAMNYTNALNPPLVALMQLERISERAPQTRARPLDASGCDVCPPGTRCPDPITARHRIPARWAAERFRLIRELFTEPDMTEDERGNAMAILIDHQQQEAG